MRLFFSAVFGVAILISSTATAQVSKEGIPPSFGVALKSTIDTRIMPAVDVEAFLAEDEKEEEDGLPFRFGAPFDVDYNLYNSGSWEELPDGSGLWRLKIISEGAYSINLLYSMFYLPEGGEFYVYSEDREMVLGAFTEENNKEYNKFATAPVKGNVTILEYHEPADMRGVGEITLSRVVHGYKDIFNFGGTKWDKGFGSSGSCNNNVNCPEGDPWRDEIRSVAMVLLSGGTRWCSGSLVNNVRADQTPYFLTANHCLNQEQYWIIMFNYQSPSCENINGPTYMTVQGTTLKATWQTSDFALLELSERPPDSYNVYYAGWSNIDVASQSSTAIHHPAGDIKKISFDYDPVTSANYLQTSGTTHWRIGNWEDGTTEGGSSGSPLFDQNHHVVGQLHGGYASCTSITPDWYGKFSLSWTGGGSSATRLKDWLDPDNSGATTLDGYDPYASVSINHEPLPDTKDTVNNYEVVATIKSNEPLITDSLKLHYEIASTWYQEIMTPSGAEDEFHAFIPAQSAGTTINYFLTAWDTAGRFDTTETFSFFIDYSPAITIFPGTYSYTLSQGDSASDMLIIENSGQGILEYNASVELTPYWKGLFEKLYAEGETEPADRKYPAEYSDYSDSKESFDYRTGFDVTKDAGGPDSFGYYWIDSDEPDGPEFDWIDISSTGDDIIGGLEDDNYDGPFEIGFDFPFYGTTYSQFYLGSNGIIGFDTASMKARTETNLPSSNTPNNILAWLWDDLNPLDADNPGVHVYHEYNDSQCVIQFYDYPEYSALPGEVVNAEVILKSDGTIIYQYLSIASGFDILSCAVGIENVDGTDGLEIAFHTSYLHDSLTVLIDRPTQWLVLSGNTGSLGEGEVDTIDCDLYTAELDSGFYTAEIVVISNDPDPPDSIQTIPVDLTVILGQTYICGDINDDEIINILDITAVLGYLYMEGETPDPLERADANGDGLVNILDITYLIAFLYKEGPDPVCQ